MASTVYLNKHRRIQEDVEGGRTLNIQLHTKCAQNFTTTPIFCTIEVVITNCFLVKK